MLKMLLFIICEAPQKISTIFKPFLAIFTLFHLKNWPYLQKPKFGNLAKTRFWFLLVNNSLCSIPVSWTRSYIKETPGDRCVLIKSFVSIQSHASMFGKDVSSYQKCDNSYWLSFDIHSPIIIVDVRLGRRRVCLMWSTAGCGATPTSATTTSWRVWTTVSTPSIWGENKSASILTTITGTRPRLNK